MYVQRTTGPKPKAKEETLGPIKSAHGVGRPLWMPSSQFRVLVDLVKDLLNENEKRQCLIEMVALATERRNNEAQRPVRKD